MSRVGYAGISLYNYAQIMKKTINKQAYRVCIAPMMDWTDRHERYFLRLISNDVRLYTEMITAHAIMHGDVNYLLKYNHMEHPIALQIGGSDCKLLQHAARVGEDFGYDEINLNVGCPSNRVQVGSFGACLMLEPELVADCIQAIDQATNLPVSIKCRIGVDQQDSYEHLSNFIAITAQAGCKIFIIHARKAWLKGLSPKQNREIPPLEYGMVRKIKQEFPELTVVINGGINAIDEINHHLKYVDGVMLGRSAYHHPYLLHEIQNYFFEMKSSLSRHDIIEKFIVYVAMQLSQGVKLSAMTRHILGLFSGQRGASIWRRFLSQNVCKSPPSVDVLHQALLKIEEMR